MKLLTIVLASLLASCSSVVEDSVKEHLRSPSTAEVTITETKRLENGRMSKGIVTAQNAYGATVTEPFTVITNGDTVIYGTMGELTWGKEWEDGLDSLASK